MKILKILKLLVAISKILNYFKIPLDKYFTIIYHILMTISEGIMQYTETILANDVLFHMKKITQDEFTDLIVKEQEKLLTLINLNVIKTIQNATN